MSRFSATVRLSSRWYCWKTNPTYFLLSSIALLRLERVHAVLEQSGTRRASRGRAFRGSPEQRRLAGARRAHDGHELALGDRRG